MAGAGRTYPAAPLIRQLELTVPPETFDREAEQNRRPDGLLTDWKSVTWSYTPSVRLMAETVGVSVRTVHRWRQGGRIPDRLAEHCALRIGLDPVLLWPDWYERVL